MSTLEFDLTEGIEPSQPTVGWHTANLAGFELGRNKADTSDMCIFTFELSDDDPDRPGLPFNYYLVIPDEATMTDFKEWVKAGRPKAQKWDAAMLTKDGRHKVQMFIARLKKMSTAFGGPESGSLSPDIFGRYLGSSVKINLVAEKDQNGQQTGRVGIGFDGVAPA